MRARSILAVLAIAGLVAACGGDGDDESSGSDTTDAGSSSDTSAPDDTTDFSIDLGGEADFGEVDGLTVRFANVYWTGGEGASIDVYWGPTRPRASWRPPSPTARSATTSPPG